MVKFWLAISKEEQYRCFKITPDDWRSGKKWEGYETAVCDIVNRTSTGIAPWVLVEANDKLHANVKVLNRLCERIGSEI
jgi:polyphosphate kinase 2 (PPK2 family)